MSERHSVAEMIGEALREMAVLFLVFIPLDRVIGEKALTPGWIVAIVALSGGLFTVGVIVERRRTS
jgi:hypothetical protein